MTVTLAGRYLLERELGHGGMATVYLAEDVTSHCRVALKVLRPELAASLGRERFLREIEIGGRLSHPHILAVHDSGEADGRLFYAMPYVEGESLRHRLNREQQLPIAETVAIITAVAGALTYAHRHGVVHRDIKPENILLAIGGNDRSVHPVVADFGIARALDAAGAEKLTATGLALGTPSYMSPEQAAAGGRIDGRSDIYSLGCVAYEMLAGEPPFTGPTSQAILARHSVDPVPSLRTVRTTVPVNVEYAVSRALAKVPADRFATADEFATALISDDIPAKLSPRRALSFRPAMLLATIAAVAAVGLGAWIVRGSDTPAVIPSAAAIAVLPFATGATDTSLLRLGRDLAITVSASLDGVGGIETADRLSVANATAVRPNLTAADGASLARRLGASSMLRGTIVRAGDNVRLDLGLYSTEGLAPVAEGITVSNHRDSIAALTDSVAWALLRQVWQRGEPPSPSLDAVTTRSVPALRAFLQGERELGANRWGEAKLAYRSAIATDSAFGLAHFRYALTRFWTHEPVEAEVLEALRPHRPKLPERERLLVDAFLTSMNAPRLKIERHAIAARRYPDYWPAWFLYADALYHGGPIAGYDWSEGLEAFRRVVSLNPDLVPAWDHIFLLTIGKDSAETARAFTRLVQLGWLDPQPPAAQLWTRLWAGVGIASGALPPDFDRLADSVAELMVSSGPDDFNVSIDPILLLGTGFPAAQLDLNHRALATGRASRQTSAALQAANAWAWAARGRWDSALTTMNEVARTESDVPGTGPPFVLQDYGLAVLGALLGATPPTLADERRPRAVAHIRGLADDAFDQFAGARLAWLDGVLGFARGDRRAIATARKALARNQWPQADLAARSLAALEQGLAGDRKGAGRKLAELEEYCVLHEHCSSLIPDIAIQRFIAARWLAETGEAEQARRILRWQDAPWLDWPWTLGYALGGPTFLARAQLEDDGGDPRRARAYYGQLLRRYDQPMQSQAHLVEEAKAALERHSLP